MVKQQSKSSIERNRCYDQGVNTLGYQIITLLLLYFMLREKLKIKSITLLIGSLIFN